MRSLILCAVSAIALTSWSSPVFAQGTPGSKTKLEVKGQKTLKGGSLKTMGAKPTAAKLEVGKEEPGKKKKGKGKGKAENADAPLSPEAMAEAKARVEERKAHREERAKLRAARKKSVAEKLDGRPMDEAMKQELRRHARNLARLNRAEELSVEANDGRSLARVIKLREHETKRHERWMAKATGKGDVAGEEPDDDKGKKKDASAKKAKKDKKKRKKKGGKK